MRRRLVALALVALVGCTPAEVRGWVAWHDADPDAAVEFAQRPEVVADLASGEHDSDGPQFAQWLEGQPTPGDCSSYVPLLEAHGLPSAVFTRIMWRESGCDHTRFTDDADDLGGYGWGLNFRTANLRAGWLSWCGATVGNIRYDADRQVRCVAAAYARLGLRPWS